MAWLARTASAFSGLLNAAVFGGNPSESVSARAWREQRRGWVRAIDALFFWEPHHCQRSHATDVEWAQQLLATGAAQK